MGSTPGSSAALPPAGQPPGPIPSSRPCHPHHGRVDTSRAGGASPFSPRCQRLALQMTQVMIGGRGTCKTPGCKKIWNATWSQHCSDCQRRAQVHGDPRQKKLDRKHLAKMRNRVTSLYKTLPPGGRDLIEKASYLTLKHLVDYAGGIILNTSDPVNRAKSFQQAAGAVLEVQQMRPEPTDLLEAVVSLYLYTEDRPEFFVSRRAWQYALVKVWRQQATRKIRAFGQGKSRRRGLKLRPMATETLATWIEETYHDPVVKTLKALKKRQQYIYNVKDLMSRGLQNSEAPSRRRTPRPGDPGYDT